MGYGGRRALNSSRRDIEHPGQDKRYGKANQQQRDHSANRRVWNIENGQDLSKSLGQRPTPNHVRDCYPINFPSLQLLEETGHKGNWVSNGTIQALIRQNNRLPRSLDPARKDSLKMRALFFPGDDADLDIPEAAFF